MPRRRFRDPDPLVRDRNMLGILGDPGLSGLSRIGARPGGGTSIVVRPPTNGLGTQTEHVTLHAVDGQTIASGGGTVSWDRIAGPPTEIVGFTTAADELASNGSIGAIPIDVTGELEVGLDGLWSTYRGGGTITLTRFREDVGQVGTDVEVIHEFEPGPIRSRFFRERQTGIDVRAGDLIEVVMPNDVAADLDWATLQLRVIVPANTTSPPEPVVPELVLLDAVGASNFGTITLDVSGFVEDDNLLVAFITCQVGGANSHPSGFTALSGSTTNSALAYRWWNTGDPTSFQWTRSTTGGAIRGLLVAVRNANPDTPLSAFTFTNAVDIANPDSFAGPAGDIGDLLISAALTREAGGNGDDKDMIAPAGATQFYDAVNIQSGTNSEHRETGEAVEMASADAPTVTWAGTWNSWTGFAVRVKQIT